MVRFLIPLFLFLLLPVQAQACKAVKLQYAHTSDTPSRLEERRARIISSVENAQAWFARETEGRLTINYGCQGLAIKEIELGPASTYQATGGVWMPKLHDELRSDSHTVTFVDGLNSPEKAGQAEPIWDGYSETNPALSPFATQPLSAVIWLGSRPLTDETVPELYPRTIAHETLHLLGAVSSTSPNSDGFAHCLDGHDILCPKQEGPCPMIDNIGRLDCGRDDYFNENPEPGSYLATHWNVANSPYLVPAPKKSEQPKTEEPKPITITGKTTKKVKIGKRRVSITRTNYSDGNSEIIFTHLAKARYCLDRVCSRSTKQMTRLPIVRASVKLAKRQSRPVLMR